jgi:hypothetical protein
MKTAQEMIYDFMLAIAPAIKAEDLRLAIGSEDDLDKVDQIAISVLNTARALTHHYLKSL